MSNRTDTTLDTFSNVYRLCRLNRGNIHFRRQFFRFNGGSVYISDDGTLLIARSHVTGAAFYAKTLLGNVGSPADYRKHWINRCRECGPVLLP